MVHALGSGGFPEFMKAFERMTPEERASAESFANEHNGHMPWTPWPGPQTEAYFSAADLLLYGGQGGGGKALAIETPIPTPGGWSLMGDLGVGDEVFDEAGKPCRVVAATPVMHGRPCYRVAFSDGSVLIADADHQWVTLTAKQRVQILKSDPMWRARRQSRRASRAVERSCKPWVSASISRLNRERQYDCLPPPTGLVRTTADIAATLMHGRERNHSVSVAGALQCADAQLLVDPYVLGLWLGDGSSYKAEITTADDEIVAAVAGVGYGTKSRGRYAYGVNGGLKVALNQLGLIANKHIPSAYLRASATQRLALLQGLMDTDGTCDVRGQCEFTVTRRRLAEDVYELVLSLGIKCTMREGVAKLNGRAIGPKFTVKFLTDQQAFRLPRKLIRQKRGGFRGTHARRYIVSVDRIDSVPVRCIEVDSPSHMYLAGRTMIPTHNSDLGLGLAFTAHKRSLILRRQYANLSALLERAIEINGSNTGVNRSPPPLIRTTDGRYIQFAGNQHPGDEQDWQGHAFDLKYFDEATQFHESMIRFHLGWIRDVSGGRCRAVLGTNPPISSDGDWIIGMFRPWLDITHPKPAKHGELRWYVRTPDDRDMEVDGPGFYQLPGARKAVQAQSRTFIPAKLSDNPALARTDYGARLDALPEPLRSAVRDGNFMAARKDAQHQVIPGAWVIAAQARWKPDGYKQHDKMTGEVTEEWQMTAIAVDPNGGGKDSEAIVSRRGPWFSMPVTASGPATEGATHAAKTVFMLRRDGAPVVIDAGGGYAGPLVERLKDNKIPYVLYKGAGTSTGIAKDNRLRFSNKRAEDWWRLREALDPDQPGGSEIALPPDPILASDLTAPCLDIAALEQRGIIQIEKKEDIRKRIGRSPDRGDAVVMCWNEGARAVRKAVSMKRNGLQSSADTGGRVLYHNRYGSGRWRSDVVETEDDGYNDEQGL